MHLINHLDLPRRFRRQRPTPLDLAHPHETLLLRQVVGNAMENTGDAAIGAPPGGHLQHRVTRGDRPRGIETGIGPAFIAIVLEQLLLAALVNPGAGTADILLQGQ
ncbi:hypothetical protein D9M68_913530 [compost metagenome]